MALSMLTLVPGGMGGSETYARALTRQLAETSEVATTAYVPATARGFSDGVPETVIESLRLGSSSWKRLRGVAVATLRAPSIRSSMAAERVVHYPFTVPVPKPARGQAMVQTLLDVQHLDLPQLFSRAELLGRPAEKIRVAHLGVDSAQFVPHFGDRDNFVLYPARGWAHKNHPRLIEAMTLLRQRIPGIRLVLTGGGLGALGKLPEWVDRRGLVSTGELHELYRTASALAFPSLYEGFGLPPLEAMASGCPAAVSDAGSIPEVCGEAAVLFDPLEPESIAEGIFHAIEHRQTLSAGGVHQAARFTWESCRDQHLLAYRQAAESGTD